MAESGDLVADGLTLIAEAELKAIGLLENMWPPRCLTRVASLRRVASHVMQQLASATVFSVAVAVEFPGRQRDEMASFAVTSLAVRPWPLCCCIHRAIDLQHELRGWSVCCCHVPSAFALTCSAQGRACWACVGAEQASALQLQLQLQPRLCAGHNVRPQVH